MKCKWLNRFIKEEKGQSLVFFAIALTVLLGITAFTVDIGYLQWQKGQLQNTADAAALAGAREFVDGDVAEIENVVEDYVEEHGIESSEIEDIIIDTENSRVTVELRGNRDLFFAKVLGFVDTDIAVMARGVVGPTGGIGEGLLPIGVRQAVIEGDDPIIITKENFGNWEEYEEDNPPIGPGNWGWVNLAYPEQSNVHDQKEYIKEGYHEPINVGDIIETDTGGNIGATAHLRDLEDTLDEYIKNKTTLYIPVICNTEGQGNYQFEVIGFAGITLLGYEGKAAKLELEVEYDPTMYKVAPGRQDNSNTGYNLKSIALDR